MNWKVTLSGLAVFLSPLFALAHGSGASLEKEVDAHIIDVGYNPETIFAESPVRFDFNAYTKSDAKDVPFTDLWVKIYQDQKIGFAGGIPKARFGATGFTYAFPAAGTYALEVRFQEGEKKIVETSFSVTVDPPVGSGSEISRWLLPGGMLLLGIGAGLFLAKQKNKVV